MTQANDPISPVTTGEMHGFSPSQYEPFERFPEVKGGLTKREYMATHLMAAMLSRGYTQELARVASEAVLAADNLIANLNYRYDVENRQRSKR